jgi:hypothetical protein
MRRRRIILPLVSPFLFSLFSCSPPLPSLFTPSKLFHLALKAIAESYTEQKRRQAIREGFDRLTELVPGLEGQGRSESVVLNKTVLYMRAQLEERKALVKRIEALGGKVDDGFKS